MYKNITVGCKGGGGGGGVGGYRIPRGGLLGRMQQRWRWQCGGEVCGGSSGKFGGGSGVIGSGSGSGDESGGGEGKGKGGGIGDDGGGGDGVAVVAAVAAVGGGGKVGGVSGGSGSGSGEGHGTNSGGGAGGGAGGGRGVGGRGGGRGRCPLLVPLSPKMSTIKLITLYDKVIVLKKAIIINHLSSPPIKTITPLLPFVTLPCVATEKAMKTTS